MAKIKVVQTKPPRQRKAIRPLPSYVATFLIAVIVAVVALALALPAIARSKQGGEQSSYQGVIELWNIETFEGGSGSRTYWLTNKSAKFESTHKGLFVHVTTLGVEAMQYKLSCGDAFDIICFSRGVGSIIKDALTPLTDNFGTVCDNLLLSAQVNNRQYAVPLYAGVYCLFARTSQLDADQLLASALTATYTRKIGKNTVQLQPLICGFTPYNSPLTALAMSGGRGNADSLAEDVTQYQAYERFVNNTCAVTLLGTQRDLYRLSQRETNGKIEQLGFTALNGYTDLVQYVGISSTTNMASCTEYVKYLLSESVQSTLTGMSMFSVLQTNIYSAQERYVQCEQALKSAFVPNVFVDGEVISNQRLTAKATLNS